MKLHFPFSSLKFKTWPVALPKTTTKTTRALCRRWTGLRFERPSPRPEPQKGRRGRGQWASGRARGTEARLGRSTALRWPRGLAAWSWWPGTGVVQEERINPTDVIQSPKGRQHHTRTNKMKKAPEGMTTLLKMYTERLVSQRIRTRGAK